MSDKTTEAVAATQEDGEIATGRWSKAEHQSFLVGLEKFGRDWDEISRFVKTRTMTQVRTHAQKYFIKRSREGRNDDEFDTSTAAIKFKPKRPREQEETDFEIEGDHRDVSTRPMASLNRNLDADLYATDPPRHTQHFLGRDCPSVSLDPLDHMALRLRLDAFDRERNWANLHHLKSQHARPAVIPPMTPNSTMREPYPRLCDRTSIHSSILDTSVCRPPHTNTNLRLICNPGSRRVTMPVAHPTLQDLAEVCFSESPAARRTFPSDEKSFEGCSQDASKNHGENRTTIVRKDEELLDNRKLLVKNRNAPKEQKDSHAIPEEIASTALKQRCPPCSRAGNEKIDEFRANDAAPRKASDCVDIPRETNDHRSPNIGENIRRGGLWRTNDNAHAMQFVGANFEDIVREAIETKSQSTSREHYYRWISSLLLTRAHSNSASLNNRMGDDLDQTMYKCFVKDVAKECLKSLLLGPELGYRFDL